MAKDKNGKKDKGEKVKKGGAAGDDFAKPSEAPSSGGNKWPVNKDNIGRLMIITPLREQTVPNKLGEPGATKQQIIADVVILNEKKVDKSEVIEDAEMEGGYVLGALRGYLGERKVLGRIGRMADPKRPGKEVWSLEDADEDDYGIAKAYLAQVDPFAQ